MIDEMERLELALDEQLSCCDNEIQNEYKARPGEIAKRFFKETQTDELTPRTFFEFCLTHGLADVKLYNDKFPLTVDQLTWTENEIRID